MLSSDSTAPAQNHAAVTPSDTVPLGACRTLKCIAAGTVAVKFASDGPVISYPMAQGDELHAEVTYVMDTDTTGAYVRWW